MAVVPVAAPMVPPRVDSGLVRLSMAEKGVFLQRVLTNLL